MAEGGIPSTSPSEQMPGCSSPVIGEKLPVCVIVLGMAGSGKTTLVQRLTAHLYAKKQPPYVVNLDPAVNEVPFPANVDIRDTVNYKEVMKQYNLGPNGAIMTSLNLFATRFDQVMTLLKQRKHETDYVIFDTPGQIEVFTWSASGTIITETLASTYPTVVAYVMDSARSVSPVTFMSNMLYACSILYRTKLPFIIVLNKADIVKPDFALDWIRNFESFQEALENETSYVSDLARSLSLVLDDFYESLKCVPFSAVTGEGSKEFFEIVQQGREEYEKDYKPEYERLAREKQNADVAKQAEQLQKFKLDRKKEKVSSDVMYTGSELFSGTRIHLGGAELEDEEHIKRYSDDDDEGTSITVQSGNSTIYGAGTMCGNGITTRVFSGTI